MKKSLIPFLCVIFFSLASAFAQQLGIDHLVYFERAYPDLTFFKRYDYEAKDWIVTISVPEIPGQKDGATRTSDFYWANGSLLPKAELANADKYWTLLYNYQKNLADPADFTEEQKERILHFGSTDNRRNGAGTPMFFFDFLYSSDTRANLEKHTARISFLGHATTVHERMKAPLKKVEDRINALAATDGEVKAFLENIRSNDAYYWRVISGTNRKSFHSLGIAIDILPKNQGGKQIYWSWAKDKFPDTWMLVPLKDRWMPPQSVISIFEEEGFIWGGKWIIYDNMHFEYHPELIQFNFYK